MQSQNKVYNLLRRFIKFLLLVGGLLTVQACNTLEQHPGGSEPMVVSMEAEIANGPIEIDVPSHVHNKYTQAIAYMKDQRYEQAIEPLQEITSSYQYLSGPMINLGLAYMSLGRDDEAEGVILRALQINPKNPEAHNILGILHRTNGRFEDAEKSYQYVLATHPNYIHAHLNLGILCDLYLYKIDCALRHYQRYLQLSGKPDKRVSMWLTDLENRSKAKAQ